VKEVAVAILGCALPVVYLIGESIGYKRGTHDKPESHALMGDSRPLSPSQPIEVPWDPDWDDL
jgi:hypothetical protein